jgi:hypothetical protein
MGMVATVLFERPTVGVWQDNGLLAKWGSPLTKLVGVPSMARQLVPYGVETRTFLLHTFIGSSLSTVHYEGARLSGIASPADLAVSAIGALARRARQGRRSIVGGYWDTVDALSHLYGPDDPRWAIELEQLFGSVDGALTLLPDAARHGTLLLILADHGHTPIRSQTTIKITDHPPLMALLDNQLGGDRRAAYLYTRQPEAARAYVEERLGHAFYALPTQQALAGGLWGPPPFHPEAARRLGDLLLVSRGQHSLLWGPENSSTLGHHGGLSPEEMLVPLIAWRLED